MPENLIADVPTARTETCNAHVSDVASQITIKTKMHAYASPFTIKVESSIALARLLLLV
jgi:hypothetical protein